MNRPERRANLETNPLPSPDYHQVERKRIDWSQLKRTDKIECERLRLLTDPRSPVFDISYFHVIVNGERYQVHNLPFTNLPKRRWKSKLVQACKDQGIFIRNLFENVSILW